MIIVSQNKISTTNFDNVTTIEVNSLNDKEYSIKAHLTNGREICLAIYKTEERAKEVLEEISERLENWENLKAGQPTGVCSYRYIMPKE